MRKGKSDLFTENFGTKFYTFKLDDWIFTPEAASDRLLKQFETSSLKGLAFRIFHLGSLPQEQFFIISILPSTEQLGHITNLSRIDEDRYVWLDKFTIKNLELFHSPYEGARTLIDVMDRTISPMGGRLLKRWISLPLKDIQPVNDRHDIVSLVFGKSVNHEEIAGLDTDRWAIWKDSFQKWR